MRCAFVRGKRGKNRYDDGEKSKFFAAFPVDVDALTRSAEKRIRLLTQMDRKKEMIFLAVFDFFSFDQMCLRGKKFPSYEKGLFYFARDARAPSTLSLYLNYVLHVRIRVCALLGWDRAEKAPMAIQRRKLSHAAQMETER